MRRLYWLAKMIHAGEDPRFITPADHDLRGGGCGSGGPDGAGAGERRRIRRRNLWAGPRRGIPDRRGDDLHCDGEQEQQRHAWPLTRRWRTCVRGGRWPCRDNFAGRELQGGGTIGAREGLPVRARFSRAFCGAGLSGGGAALLRATEQGAEKKIKERLEKWRGQFDALRK